jgi:hypothetical protein
LISLSLSLHTNTRSSAHKDLLLYSTEAMY